MKLTDTKQITDESLTKGELTASILTEFFTEKLSEANEKFVADTTAKETELSAAIAAKELLATEVETEKSAKAALQIELDTIKADVAAREEAELFSTRIGAISEDYDFNDEEKQIVAERIKGLTPEGFEKYLKELEVIAKGKKKEVIKDEKKEVKADEVIANLKVDEKQDVIPNAANNAEDLKDKWKNLFASVEVKK